MDYLFSILKRFFSEMFGLGEFLWRMSKRFFYAWLMSAVGSLVAIFTVSLFAVKCVYSILKYVGGMMATMNSNLAEMQSINALDGTSVYTKPFISEFLAFLNYALPLDEVILLVTLCLSIRVTIFAWRAFRKFVPIPTAQS
jgi:hypothetical protein